jgi:predicted lipoprotein
LATSIDSQFSAILSDINLLTLSLEAEMTTNPSALDNLYTKMQNLVVSIKTDMASSFGVLITYQDNDGD